MHYLTDFCCLCLRCNINVSSHININSNTRQIMDYVIPKLIFQKSEIPIQVCDDCSNNMNNFYRFRQTCQKNMTLFTDCVHKLIEEHGPYKYLTVTIDNISRKVVSSINTQNSVDNSKETNCTPTVKSEILVKDEENNLLTEHQSESDNKNIEEVLIKTEKSDDNLHIKQEITEEVFIKDYPSLSDNNVEDNNSSISYVIQGQNSFGLAVPSNIGNINGIQQTFLIESTEPQIYTIEKPLKVTTSQSSTLRPLLPKQTLIQEGEQLYSCNICHQIFKALNALRAHKTIHEESKKFSCKSCFRSYPCIEYLKKHEQVHLAEKTHKCNVCDRTFARANSFKRHMRVHTGERPYQCELCPKTFGDSGNLQSHMRVHTGDRPFVCDVCEKAFTQSHTLKAHRRTAHVGVGQKHSCNECHGSGTCQTIIM